MLGRDPDTRRGAALAAVAYVGSGVLQPLLMTVAKNAG
eukprot:SAG31_NODE_5930_length_2253_cov_1.243733_4_plen_37_part_01